MTTETDAHYWVIQAADGPESPGVCQRCGEKKTFKNFVEETAFMVGSARKATSRPRKTPFNGPRHRDIGEDANTRGNPGNEANDI